MPRPVSKLLTQPAGLAHALNAVVSRSTLNWVVRLCPLLVVCLQPNQSRAQSQTYELTTQALATTADLERGKALYQRICERCHDAGGSGNRDREVPRLAGQQRIYLLNQLVQFITLDRYAPSMHRILARPPLLDPQSLSDLSAYLAAQPPDSHGEHGDPHWLGLGRILYNLRCAQCHGTYGEGNAQGPIPAVGGQNYSYLLGQLNGFAVGHRTKVESDLLAAVRSLSTNDTKAVADYMSRMPESVDPHYGVVF
jgi:cytochrome c553